MVYKVQVEGVDQDGETVHSTLNVEAKSATRACRCALRFFERSNTYKESFLIDSWVVGCKMKGLLCS